MTFSTVAGMSPDPRPQPRPQDATRTPAPRLRLRQTGTRKLSYAPITPPIIYTPAPAPHTETEAETKTGRDLSLRGYMQSVRGDLYRKKARSDTRTLLSALLTDSPFKHTFWFRTASFVWGRPALRYTLYPLVRTIYRHYQHKHWRLDSSSHPDRFRAFFGTPERYLYQRARGDRQKLQHRQRRDRRADEPGAAQGLSGNR